MDNPSFPHHASEAFSKEALDRVARTIEEVEQTTSAEIRISIRDTRDSAEAGLTIQQMALKEFEYLKMDKTKDRTGVLLLILYDERQFYVYGDAGINERSNPETWEDVARILSEHFRVGKFEDGLHAALRAIASHVTTILPHQADDTDELSNEVIIR